MKALISFAGRHDIEEGKQLPDPDLDLAPECSTLLGSLDSGGRLEIVCWKEDAAMISTATEGLFIPGASGALASRP